MKKLLVLVLVLGMASLANAGLITASSTTPFVITITAADVASAADVYIDYTNYVAAGGNTADAVLVGSGASIANLFVFTVGDQGADAYYAALGNMSSWANGATLATLDLNGAGANIGSTQISMDLIDGNTSEVIGSVSVMIPEPATIALLCIGGMLLRKKK